MTSLTSTLPERAKRCKIFLNGDNKFVGKYVVLNRRRIRTFDGLLQEITSATKSNLPVRSIRTPVGGSKVDSLDAMKENSAYVAVASGRFKKLG